MKLEWNSILINALLRFRAEGYTLKACARKLGISHQLCATKARELGINQRMNIGRRNGRRALVEPPFDKLVYDRNYYRKVTRNA